MEPGLLYSSESESPHVSDETLEAAAIGDILLVSDDRPLPPSWQTCDGREVCTSGYPRFATQLGIAEETFRLPIRHTRPGTRWVVKLR